MIFFFFFCIQRNSSQVFQCKILLPSFLLQVGGLNADPRRHKVSIRCTSTKAVFQGLISVLLRYYISPYIWNAFPRLVITKRGMSILPWKSGTEIWFSSVFRQIKQPTELPALWMSWFRLGWRTLDKLVCILFLLSDHFEMGMHVLLMAHTSWAWCMLLTEELGRHALTS